LVPIDFLSGNLSTLTATRTNLAGNSWIAGDSIGIYMLADTQANISINYYANRKYIASANGSSNITFNYSTIEQAIYYKGNTPLRFIAYYPYRQFGYDEGTLNDHIYPVNIMNQEDTSGIDLMYSRNARAHVQTDPPTPVKLQFGHVLSKLRLHVRKKPGADIDISGATSIINGVPATAYFQLEDSILSHFGTSQSIAMYGTGTPPPNTLAPNGTGAYDTTYQAILIPHAVNGSEIQFTTQDNRLFTWPIPEDYIPTFEAGKLYTFWLTLEGETVVDYSGYKSSWNDDLEDTNFETPLIPEDIIDMILAHDNGKLLKEIEK
jgi:hypothetical protein